MPLRGTSAGYLSVQPSPNTPVRLFCFHHAGGTAASFDGWQRALGPEVEVLPVQLARREPRHYDMDSLVRDLHRELAPWLVPPYLFYGHSMGAAVAFNVAQQRLRRDQSMPERLLVAACVAPHFPHALAPVQQMSDDQVVQSLIDIGGMSAALLEFPDWVRAKISLVRDDLRIYGSQRSTRGQPLPCPIDVFTGDADPMVTAVDVGEWALYTRATCEVHTVPGGHFFAKPSNAAFIGVLRSVLASVPRRGTQMPHENL